MFTFPLITPHIFAMGSSRNGSKNRPAGRKPTGRKKCFAVFVELHGIIHTHDRNSPVEKQGFF